MKKILVVGASNSRHSINKKFASWASKQMADNDAKELDLNDYEMPIFSIDREEESGIPNLAYTFKAKIKESDALIISLAEHNGSYTAAFKNIIDWISRIEKGIWADKPMLLLATSPGKRGGMGVLNIAKTSFPHQGAQVVGSFSLPSFNQNFDETEGLLNEELKIQFFSELDKLNTMLSRPDEIGR